MQMQSLILIFRLQKFRLYGKQKSPNLGLCVAFDGELLGDSLGDLVGLKLGFLVGVVVGLKLRT